MEGRLNRIDKAAFSDFSGVVECERGYKNLVNLKVHFRDALRLSIHMKMYSISHQCK